MILSCTNRPESNTLKVCAIYDKLLQDIDVGSFLLDFRTLPRDIAFSGTFGTRSDEFSAIIEKYIRPFHRFIFIVPEYNGSFPGILKLFLDITHPRDWNDKSACLVGVSDGRAGNLRGLEHLTGILNYLKVHVYHDKLPISVINSVMNDAGEFVSPGQQKVCKAQVEGFLKFSRKEFTRSEGNG
jgi:chromate reductase, NAD(P)H dehydrogenase (quinone)